MGANAEKLFAKSRQSVLEVTKAGSERARDAESQQSLSVDRIRQLSTGAFAVVGLAGLGTMLAAALVSGRIRRSILSAEEKDKKASGRMRSVVGAIQQNTGALHESSENLSQNSAVVSASMESISASADQMQQTIARISETTAAAAQVGAEAAGKAATAAATFQRLHAASVRINKITGVIRGISFQTHMLALNAAVEAARSGEHGKGFSVVAEEVRKLAAAAAASVAEIDQSVQTTQAEVLGATTSMTQIEAVIKNIREMQESIAEQVARQTQTTHQITESIRQAVDAFTGIGTQAQQLSKMAADLDRVSSSADRASGSLVS